ncbi:MAG: hypothetical protein HY064_06640 [Bacteroidetes bacterium]|nr:hypothetical protein [Bacteroidota bacterium]
MKFPFIQRNLLGAFFFYLISSSCAPKEQCNCNSNELAEVRYDSSIQAGKSKYADYLKRFNELPLVDEDHYCVRFIFSSSFGYGKVYRLEQVNDQWMLFTKQFDIKYQSDNDSLSNIRQKAIPEKDGEAIKKMISDSCFWTMNSEESRGRAILDGSGWTLEVFDPEGNSCTGKNYHIVSSISTESSHLYSINAAIIKFEPLPYEW